MKTIWLSSYPKSGNTWVASFLYHYFFGAPKNSSEIMERIPDIHQLMANNLSLNENSDHNNICKSHFIYFNAHPHINTTAGFIYLLRHPKDVLLSGLHFLVMHNPDTKIDAYQYAINFIEYSGDFTWQNMGFGTWPQHVESWHHAANYYNSIFVHYEALRRNPQKFKDIIHFLSPEEINEEQFQYAVRQTTFANMRQLEKEEKQNSFENSMFPGGKSSLENGHYFVNKGAVGQNLSHIGADLDERFDEKFSAILSKLGYPLTEDNYTP